MLLSSVNRALLYSQEQDNANNRRQILDWLSSISLKVEKFLQCELEIKSRTQDFDTIMYRQEYFPKSVPILSDPTPTLDFDPLGLYTGGETRLNLNEDYIIGAGQRSIVILYPREPAYRGLRLTYTGGLAYHAVNSVFAYTAGTGTLRKDMFVVGDDTASLGRVVSVGDSLTIEVLAGYFSETESITAYSDIGLTNSANVTATLTSVTRRALVENNPDIVKAVEIELRFMIKHALDFENISTMQGQTTRRSTPTIDSRLQMVQQEAEALLTPYRRWAVV